MASKNKPTGDFVVGLDIGYSNVKMAYGHADKDQPGLMVRPSQDAPVTCLNGNIDLKDGEHYVYLNNEQWVGFVNPGRSGVKRELHADYPSTDTYRALFNASISEVCADGRSVIDHLITGLPVKQARSGAGRTIDCTTHRHPPGITQTRDHCEEGHGAPSTCRHPELHLRNPSKP